MARVEKVARLNEGARVGEGERGSARVGEGRAKSSSIKDYINHERFFDINRSVSPLFKGGWLDFAQDGKLNFLSEMQLSKKWAIEYLK